MILVEPGFQKPAIEVAEKGSTVFRPVGLGHPKKNTKLARTLVMCHHCRLRTKGVS